MNLLFLSKDTKVWIPDSEQVWMGGTLLKDATEDTLEVLLEDGRVSFQIFPCNRLLCKLFIFSPEMYYRSRIRLSKVTPTKRIIRATSSSKERWKY